MRLRVDNLGAVGLVKDMFSHDLAPEAWTTMRNARMGPYGAEKFLGHSKTLGTDSAGWAQQPIWLFHVPVAGGVGYWVGAGLTKVYAREAQGYGEDNITRQTAAVDVDYAADATRKWNGGMFGGILVLNNGIDIPQYWSDPASVPKLENLSASGSSPWDSTWRARVLKPFGRFLVALDVTKGSTNYPQMVKWGHPAEAGTLPNSWDEADPSNDAGEFPLQDAAGKLVDCDILRGNNMLYTTDQIWTMRLVPGGDIFGFDNLLAEQGALATHCVTRFKKSGMQHFVLGGDDIFVHNGQDADSVITPVMRRWFFQQIDPTYAERSFVVTNPLYSEIWACIPENGCEQPTLALVWNWETGAIGFRELLVDTSGADTRDSSATYGTPCIELGMLDAVASESWDSDASSWDSDSTIWQSNTTNPVVPRLLMADRSAGNRMFLIDNTEAFDGATITCMLEREGLSLLGRDRQGQPKTDSELDKLLTEIWPRFDAADGTSVTVDVGVQNDIDEAVTWQDSYTYVVGTDPFIPTYNTGRYISLRFTVASTAAFKALGYALEIVANGSYT